MLRYSAGPLHSCQSNISQNWEKSKLFVQLRIPQWLYSAWLYRISLNANITQCLAKDLTGLQALFWSSLLYTVYSSLLPCPTITGCFSSPAALWCLFSAPSMVLARWTHFLVPYFVKCLQAVEFNLQISLLLRITILHNLLFNA